MIFQLLKFLVQKNMINPVIFGPWESSCTYCKLRKRVEKPVKYLSLKNFPPHINIF